jgi:hypothetical protein
MTKEKQIREIKELIEMSKREGRESSQWTRAVRSGLTLALFILEEDLTAKEVEKAVPIMLYG